MPVEEIGYLFSNLGVPTAFAILLYLMYDKNQKWWQEQSIAQDKRHEELSLAQDKRHEELSLAQNKRHEDLTNKFLEELNKINVNHKLDDDLTNRCLMDLSQKVEMHIRQKEDLIRLSNNNFDLLKEKDNTINELFNMLKEQIKTNRQIKQME